MTVKENTESYSINTINSFVQYSKGLWRKNRPWGQTVFVSLEKSLILFGAETFFWSGGVTESYIHLV